MTSLLIEKMYRLNKFVLYRVVDERIREICKYLKTHQRTSEGKLTSEEGV